MPVSAFPDPILTITGPAAEFTFQAYEIPEFIKFGGPFRAIVHKQPGGTRQVDSMGPDPGPITWDGIMISADGWDRAQRLYAMYEAGDKVTVLWRGWARDCIISDLKIRYRAVNYTEYMIELTEVVVTGIGNAGSPTLFGDLNNLANAAKGIADGGGAV